VLPVDGQGLHAVESLGDEPTERVLWVEPLFGPPVKPIEVAEHRADDSLDLLGLPALKSHRVAPVGRAFRPYATREEQWEVG
jgi:hypothetical protein